MIDFNCVSKIYENGTKALNDVSLHIDKGEFVFVVGASGAGKSTFLKLMMREEAPSSGTININGFDVGELKTRNIPYLRRSMGIVFQDFRLIPNMTVYDNVAFAMRVVGAKKSNISIRVPYVINIVGLSAKSKNYPAELSGGEQQRVALARALANNPDIIIADEPTGNVDPKMSYEIVELLQRLNEAGTTVIMVTHAHDLVKIFNKRVVVIENGSVVSDGYLDDNASKVVDSIYDTSDLSLESKFIKNDESEQKESVLPEFDDEKSRDSYIDEIIDSAKDYSIYVSNDDSE